MNLLGLLWLRQDFLLDLFCQEIQSWYSFPQLWAYQAFYEWATCWVGLQSQCPIRSAATVFRFQWQTKSEKKDGKEKRKHVKREKWGLAPGSSLPSRLSCCSFQFPREKIKNCSENNKKMTFSIVFGVRVLIIRWNQRLKNWLKGGKM